jgi:DNA topoisomerase-3
MDSDTCMKVAEELYTKGFISYPRTETERFSPETDLATLIREQDGHPQWGAYASALLPAPGGGGGEGGGGGGGGGEGGGGGGGKFLFPRKGDKDDQAHPPIHPTRRATPHELGGPNEQVFFSFIYLFILIN